MQKPRQDLVPNTVEYETIALVKPTGFREYDARWILEKEINLLGIQALGLGLATYVHEIEIQPRIVVGHDFRSYSITVKQALILGLLEGGMEVLDIGLALSPMAYFGQFALEAPCVAMVTASHNENGWTGVKMGANPPVTFGPEEIGRLKEIVLEGQGVARPGGRLERVEDFRERYWDEVVGDIKLTRPLKVVCAMRQRHRRCLRPRGPAPHGGRGHRDGCRARLHLPQIQSEPRRPRHADADGGQGARNRRRSGPGLRRRRRPLRRGGRHGRGNLRRQDRPAAGPRPVGPARERDLRRRCEIDRPLQDRRGAEGQRRDHRLLEDGAQLHQAQDRRTGGPGRVREVGPLLPGEPDRPRLRRRHRGRRRGAAKCWTATPANSCRS